MNFLNSHFPNPTQKENTHEDIEEGLEGGAEDEGGGEGGGHQEDQGQQQPGAHLTHLHNSVLKVLKINDFERAGVWKVFVK